MTHAKTIKSAAPSANAGTVFLRPTTLILAAVVALEVAGLRALAPSEASPAYVASVDGTVAQAPAAPVRRLRAASVEVRVVAQADLPAAR
jgi:hypothetical protein